MFYKFITDSYMKKETSQTFKPGFSPDTHAVINAFTNIPYTKKTSSNRLISELHEALTHTEKKLKSDNSITHNDFFQLLEMKSIDAFRLIKKFIPDRYINFNNTTLTKEGVEYCNTIIQESYNFYEQFLLRTFDTTFMNKWKKHKKIFFWHGDEVIDFITTATQSKNKPTIRQMYCSLLKIAYSVNYMKQHPKIFEKEKKFESLVSDYIFPCFNIQEAKNLDSIQHDNIKCSTKPELMNSQPILFKSSGRVKDDRKILVKLIWNPQYNELDAMKDINGLRFEVKSKQEWIKLLEYIYIQIFNQTWKIKNKKFATLEEIESYFKNLDEQFSKTLSHSLSIGWRQSKTNKKYKDIKIIGILEGEEIEIQIVLVNNQNESWYAHHGIYDCIKKIEALVRLQWYITETMIERYINDTLSSYPEDLWHFKSHNILDYFVNEKTIAKINIPWQPNKKYYTTPERWNVFHTKENKDLYPAWTQIFFENEWKYEQVLI